MNEPKNDGGAAVPCISLLADWGTRPHDRLRKFPNGTPFLLRLHTGAVHACELCGNMESDQSWKARRLTDGKVIRLENLQRAEFILLTANATLQGSPEAQRKENPEAIVRHGFHHAPWDYCQRCAHYFLAETSPTGQQGCELAYCESLNGVCKSAVLPNAPLERSQRSGDTLGGVVGSSESKGEKA